MTIANRRTAKKILKLILWPYAFAFFSVSGCNEPAQEITNQDELSSVDKHYWRYFDREVYFPVGVSVSPEQALAQEVIKDSLEDLAASSDLGLDYFIFLESEDSLLQPIIEDSKYIGRKWSSFIQTWSDGLFAELAVNIDAATKDPDIIAAKNTLNDREFYIVFRADCFTSSESCNFPSQTQSKLMVWRAFGYMLNMKSGEEAGNDIMKIGHHTDQESDDERRKFIAEFNGALELIRNDLPSPSEQKADVTELPEDVDSLDEINDKLTQFENKPTDEDLEKILGEEEGSDSSTEEKSSTGSDSGKGGMDELGPDTIFNY